MNGTRMLERFFLNAVWPLVILASQAAIALAALAGVVVATPVRVTAATVAPSPQFATMRRRLGPAKASLDTIAIDGKRTTVAGLRRPRAFRIGRADTVVLNGWALDPVAAAPAGGLGIHVGGRDEAATYGLARPDVANAFKNPYLMAVGFSARISGRVLHPGANDISLLVVSGDGKAYYVDPTPVTLDLR